MSKMFKLECPHCDGWGYTDQDVRKQCADCNGSGKLRRKDYKNASAYADALKKARRKLSGTIRD